MRGSAWACVGEPVGADQRRLPGLMVLLALLAGAVTGSPLAVQAQAPLPMPSGFWYQSAVEFTVPTLGGDNGPIWDAMGGLRAGPGIRLGAGVDGDRVGFGLGLTILSLGVGDHRQATGTSLSAEFRYRLVEQWMESWHTVLSLGYVRTTIGPARVGRGEIPESLGLFDPARGGPLIVEVASVGDGARFNVELLRSLSPRITVEGRLGLDVVRLGHLSVDAFNHDIPTPGVSLLPVLSIGMRIWTHDGGRESGY
ncbi:MAG: hypothetical protein RQ751_06665 [Longimicrobiales bacterium]|nr:hypothetical protein [Longimicrobiales bacterium]